MTRLKTGLFATIAMGALLTTLTPLGAAPKAAPAAAISAALADAGRPETDKAQDASRHPADLIAFMGVKRGMAVGDVWPGRGYWTRIFSVLVGPKGTVVSYVPAEITDMKSDPMKIINAVAAEPGRGNVTVLSDPLASPAADKDKNSLDVVWTFENYHDLHNPLLKGASVEAFDKAVYDVLKPGGYYVIGDHAAPAGSGFANTNDLHRIDPAALRAEVEKAGFIFDGESKVLANPDDPRTAKVFDPALRGNTDRFVYRFRKPKK